MEGRNLFALQGEALRTVRREVQIVFQDPYSSLDPRMRVGEILEEGLLALRPDLQRDERRERVAQLLRARGAARRCAVELSARVLGRAAPAHRHRARVGRCSPS